jgi:glucosamine--fructose-6-phosphate aminotransferase (isomerizing)
MEQEVALLRTMNQPEEIFSKPAQAVLVAAEQKKSIYFVGCGTAAHMCMVAETWFSLAEVPARFCTASQFSRLYPFIEKGSVVVAVSQSGETADVLEVAERCKTLGATIISVVNTETSSLARMSDYIIPIKAGREIGVAATKTAICQLTALLLFSTAIGVGVPFGREILMDTEYFLKEQITPKYLELVKRIAEKFRYMRNLYVIGRGALYPLALEGALKINEVSYIHAEGLDAGELKHGPIALIEKGTVVLALVPCDETLVDILNTLSEICARGAVVVGISPKNNNLFSEWIPIGNVLFTPSFLSLVPLQMFAYFLAVFNGKNPDKPRNLAKSVTVK